MAQRHTTSAVRMIASAFHRVKYNIELTRQTQENTAHKKLARGRLVLGGLTLFLRRLPLARMSECYLLHLHHATRSVWSTSTRTPQAREVTRAAAPDILKLVVVFPSSAAAAAESGNTDDHKDQRGTCSRRACQCCWCRCRSSQPCGKRRQMHSASAPRGSRRRKE